MPVAISSVDYNGGTVNMTTEGLEDWLSPTATGPSTTLRIIGTPQKRTGGKIVLGFDWANPGGAGITQAMGITRTSTLADTADTSATTTAAINTTTGVGFNHATILQLGWRFKVHASEQPRRLRIYTSHFSSQLTVIARLDGVDTTSSFDSGAAAVSRRQWTLDYTSPNFGAEMLIACNIDVGHGSTPNILLGCITLARI